MTSTDAPDQPTAGQPTAGQPAVDQPAAGQPAPADAPVSSGASAPADHPRPADAPARLVRSRTDRYLGGVCGGLATHLGVDVTLLRILMVVLAVVGNLITVPLYLACWVIVPEEQDLPSGRALTSAG